MGESTRPLPSLTPLPNGGWEARSYLSSREFTIRGLGLLPANSVIPVIVVPGIMGTNLRAKRKPRLGRTNDERNQKLQPGAPAWRPPNGKADGLMASIDWDSFSPSDRQKLFDAATLEVDDSGVVVLPDTQEGYVLSEAEVRDRGWGEGHADSYGELLYTLQTRLNQTFGYDDREKRRFVIEHWNDVMKFDPRRWGVRDFEPITVAQLERHALNYFPVYFVGYNWLDDCEKSSQRLESRILEIIDSWASAKRRCDKVIVVTHSMGGLVARACAKRIPSKIGGVIHGVMPALGAPAAYRRLVGGTEISSPSSSPLQDFTAWRLSKILGDTTERTTAVLATSPGALELLPNHLYQQPWLRVRVMVPAGATAMRYGNKDDNVRTRYEPHDCLQLPSPPSQNPYDLYRDTNSWYRLVDPALADPAAKYRMKKGGVRKAIEAAVDVAEKFHRNLGAYYHPNTYVFYGDDPSRLSYGRVTWVARQQAGAGAPLSASSVAKATFLGRGKDGQRRVLVEGKTKFEFALEAQDAAGDGTVPRQSGAGATPHSVKQVFATRGYDHQDSYNNEDILKLTLRLIVKIAQEMS